MTRMNNRKHPVKISILQGDVFETVSKLNADFFDGCLNDGPYGLTDIGKRVGKKGFLDQTWDGALPPAEAWHGLLRVCKPGSGMLSFGHPRTYHRLACNIEDAGWELRDCLMWLYGQGMPKSHDIGKAIDRLNPRHPGNGKSDRRSWSKNAAKAAQLWRGYGFGLKPGYEPVVLAMKSCEESFAKNALQWGVAGLNIDGCRIGSGRYPANVILDEEAGRLLDKQSPINKGGKYRNDAGGASHFFLCTKASPEERNKGLEGFPKKRPDKRNPKAMGMWDKKGIAPQQNHGPCVKPLALCRYLATLLLPPERDTPRRLIVPFAGTGSEMIAAMQAGWDEIVGIEMNEEYVRIAKARIARWMSQ